MKAKLITLTLFSSLIFQAAHAQFDETAFKQALKVKKNVYLSEGTFSGGDRMSSDFRITNVRVAANPAGYDRLVVDLLGNEGAMKTSLSRPPFYMVENDPGNKRVLVTVFGRAKLDFSSQASIQSAKKTKHVSKLEFLPIVDADRWIFTIHTQTPVKAEVFELTEPARIIIDLKP